MHQELRHKLNKYIGTLEHCASLLGNPETGPSVEAVVTDLRRMLEPAKLETTTLLLCRLCKSNQYRSVFRFRRLLSRRWGLTMECVDLSDVTATLALIIECSGNPLNLQQLVHDLSPSQDWRFTSHEERGRYEDPHDTTAYCLRLLDRLVTHIRFMDVEHLPGYVDTLHYRNFEKRHE